MGNLLLSALTPVVAAAMFAVVVFFTRATFRRAVGALIAGLPLIPLIIFYDAIAARRGWWYYPSVNTGFVLVSWYLAAALWYGSGLGLVGWRVIRCFGSAGLAGFLVGFAILGTARDYLYSATTRLIVFGPGPVPWIADLFAYVSVAVVVQLLMYWVSGAPKADPLARRSATASNS
jgi:hypothetical protein